MVRLESIWIFPVPFGLHREVLRPSCGLSSSLSGEPSPSESGLDAMVVKVQLSGAVNELPGPAAMEARYVVPFARGQFGVNVASVCAVL